MVISINTNIDAILARRSLGVFESQSTDMINRLSSGNRINSASDDAANLTLSKKVDSTNRGLRIANDNIQTGINRLQMVDGYLDNVANSLQRMRDLAVQSANGAYGDDERAMLDNEAQELLKEIQQGTKVANNDMQGNYTGEDKTLSSSISIQIGSDVEDVITYDDVQVDTNFTVDLSTQEDSVGSMNNIDDAIEYISSERSKIGSNITTLESMVESNSVRSEGLTNSLSLLRDTDMAYEASMLAKNQISTQGAASILQQAKNFNANTILSLY